MRQENRKHSRILRKAAQLPLQDLLAIAAVKDLTVCKDGATLPPGGSSGASSSGLPRTAEETAPAEANPAAAAGHASEGDGEESPDEKTTPS